MRTGSSVGRTVTSMPPSEGTSTSGVAAINISGKPEGVEGVSGRPESEWVSRTAHLLLQLTAFI